MFEQKSNSVQCCAMLDERRGHQPGIVTTLSHLCLVLSLFTCTTSLSTICQVKDPVYGIKSTSHLRVTTPQQNTGINQLLFHNSWSTVFDAGPTLKQHKVNSSCFLGHYWRVESRNKLLFTCMMTMMNEHSKCRFSFLTHVLIQMKCFVNVDHPLPEQ